MRRQERNAKKSEQTNEDSGSDDDMDDIVVPDDDVTSWKRDASHVLTRVRQKLQGQEEPNGEALGVAGQVSRLLNEARDKEKLSLMFHGWAAWV